MTYLLILDYEDEYNTGRLSLKVLPKMNEVFDDGDITDILKSHIVNDANISDKIDEDYDGEGSNRYVNVSSWSDVMDGEDYAPFDIYLVDNGVLTKIYIDSYITDWSFLQR